MNLRRCLWCLLPADFVGGEPAFRPAGRVLQLVESDYSFLEPHKGNARQLHDRRRLAAGLRRLDERAAVHGRICGGCEARGADFDPVGMVERGEVIL